MNVLYLGVSATLVLLVAYAVTWLVLEVARRAANRWWGE